MDDAVRLDKWLWAARFFKTRALASDAVARGKVHWNGVRCKPARNLAAGATLRIENDASTWEVVVLALAERRGPAAAAQALYAETAASLARRRLQAERARLAAEPTAALKGRPTKRARRQLDRSRD